MITSSDEAVYRRAAADLARIVPPDLSALPAGQVEIAMVRAFGPNGPREDWLNEFRGRVKQASEDRVRMDPVDPAAFPGPPDKSPVASHQQLVDSLTSAVQLLVMGPFDPPFRFVTGSPEEVQEQRSEPGA